MVIAKQPPSFFILACVDIETSNFIDYGKLCDVLDILFHNDESLIPRPFTVGINAFFNVHDSDTKNLMIVSQTLSIKSD